MLKKIVPALLVVAFVAAMFVVPAQAAAPKTYQVTGPVVELTADTIVVMKGKDRWEVARDANTKVTGDLKVGSKVTIEYRMTAATVEVKADTKAAKGAKAAAKPSGSR